VKKRAVSVAAYPSACCDNGPARQIDGRQNMPPALRPAAIKGLARLRVAAKPKNSICRGTNLA
jgi:hypothetical protein